MAKSSPKPKAFTNISAADKLFVPGINITELLEFESLFSGMRYYIATLMLAIVTIAQIRLTLMSSKPNTIQALPSVNLLNRAVLAKSPPLLYVTSAVALRRTAIAYANDETEDQIIIDHNDLNENPTGPVITRGGITSALNDPARLRSYRRGLMAQCTGEMQATPIHAPRRLARDIEKINREDFLSRLPFKTDDFTIDDIYNTVNKLISPNGNVLEIVESPTIAEGDCRLEIGLKYKRLAPVIPDISGAPADISKLPAWRRAAIQQAKNIGGG